MSDQEVTGLVVGQWQFPEDWPTHRGSKELWEELGRTVGAFTMLANILPRAIRAITGHLTMKAALEDPDSVLKTDFAGLLAEIEELRKPRNRLCHGAWIAFETPVLATVRFFPNGGELDKTHQQVTSLDDLTSTKNRVMAVIGELETKVEETPVHDPTAALWEEIGRTVATFGTLEDLLPRALYIITGHQRVDEAEDANQQVNEWCAELIKSMSDTLGGLAHTLKAAWKERDGGLHPKNAEIVQEIRALAKFRNRVCHATYQDFMAPHVAQMNDRANDLEVNNTAREADAITALQDARLRVLAAVAALRTEVRVRYQSGFPGANDS